jgi:hypothetical protein
VRQEILLALELGLLVVPVLVDGAPTLSADQLPAELRPLAERQYVRLGHKEADADVARLIRRLEARFRAHGASPRPHLDGPQSLVLASGPILLTAMFLPWADDSLPVRFDWQEWTYGTVLPLMVLIIIGYLVAAGALLLGRFQPIALGLAGGAGLLGAYLLAYDVLEIGRMEGVSSPELGWFVYLFGVLLLLTAAGWWLVRERARPPLVVHPRSQVFGGALVILAGQLSTISSQRVGFTVGVAVVVLAIVTALLVPRRISVAVRIAVLTGFTAVGVGSALAVTNFLARQASEGASIGGFTGRIALEIVVAAGLWIALARPQPVLGVGSA